jgi:hypothetical protein
MIPAKRWWTAYERYLQSPLWAERRQKVLVRARNICEGCGARRASEVHHVHYPARCLPGSRAWVAQEKLYMLVAVCSQCHQDLHPRANQALT